MGRAMDTVRSGKVYRVEHTLGKACGPNSDTFYAGPYKSDYDVSDRIRHSMERHPAPSDIGFDIQAYHYCAFESIDSLCAWYDVPALRILHEQQFVLGVYDCTYVHTRLQVFIHGHDPVTYLGALSLLDAVRQYRATGTVTLPELAPKRRTYTYL